MNQTIEVPEVSPTEGILLAEKSKALEIKDEYGVVHARTFLRDAKVWYDKVDSLLGDAVKAAHNLHKSLTSKRAELIAPVQIEEKAVRARLSAYLERVELERLNEQRRLQAEAQAKADAEMKAQQALADEAAALAEEHTGEEIKPEIVATIIAPAVKLEAPKVAGVSARKVWTFEITDAALIPREFLMVDEQKLAKYATAMRDSAKCAGVRFYEKTVASIR